MPLHRLLDISAVCNDYWILILCNPVKIPLFTPLVETRQISSSITCLRITTAVISPICADRQMNRQTNGQMDGHNQMFNRLTCSCIHMEQQGAENFDILSTSDHTDCMEALLCQWVLLSATKPDQCQLQVVSTVYLVFGGTFCLRNVGHCPTHSDMLN